MVVESAPIKVAGLIERGLLVINDGYRAKNSELADHGLPFARGGNIAGGFHFEDADRFPEETLNRIGDKVSQPGDVVFTSKGTVGRFAFVTEETPRFVYSPQLCFWRSLDPNVIYPRWLFYWMQGGEFFSQYAGVKGQTDMADYVSLGDQRRMLITLPPVQEQRRIAEILGALDEKIELNQRMNRLLVALGRAIFRAWFIDFEPVKAKAGGRVFFPGMPQAVFNKLPDRFTEGDGDPIPIGWRVEPLSQFVELFGGGTPKRNVPEYWGGHIPWFSVRDAPAEGDVWVIDTEDHITQAGIENSSARLLRAGTTIISARGTVGRLALTGVPMAINQSCYGILGAPGISDTFAYFTLHHAVEELQQRTHGSVFDTITRDTFDVLRRVRPPSEIIDAFERIAAPYLQLILTNVFENRALVHIRDTLLPKLISGIFPASNKGAGDGR